MPYLELLAPAGSLVIFLVPIAVNLYRWWGEALTVPIAEPRNSLASGEAAIDFAGSIHVE